MSTTGIDKVHKAVRKIEKALQINLEEESDDKSQDNSYKSYGGSRRKIDNLTLSNIHFENFEPLRPVYKMVNRLTLINCTIADVAALANLKYINHLTLDNVKIKDVYKPHMQPLDTIKCHFQTVEFKNMAIAHTSVLLPLSKNLQYLHFIKCKVSNFYEVNLLPDLYSLTLEETTIHQTTSDIVHTADSDRRFIFLDFKHMQLDNFDAFLPISKNITSLELNNCQVGSFQGMHQFAQLKRLEIDAATTIGMIKFPKTPVKAAFRSIACEITRPELYDGYTEEERIKYEMAFDLKKLASIAPYIKSLILKDYKLSNTRLLKHFTRLKILDFEKSKVNLHDFLSAAPQIKMMSFDTCTLRKTNSLALFTRLESLHIEEGYDNNGKEVKALKDFKKLLPLKNQLKRLRLWESDVKALKHIKAFTTLESLCFFEVSKKTAEHIFTLPNLKKLSLNIGNKRADAFDLKRLTKIEWLVIDADHKATLKGFKHMKHLKRLELEGFATAGNIHHLKNLKHLNCNNATNINKVATIKTLQTLELNIDEHYKINGLQQFPNLKNLSIKGGHKNIVLGKLEKLKKLDMEGGGSDDKIDFLTQLPNLEKLDLGSKGLKEIPDLSKLTSLKMLNLSENYYIKNIEGLKSLKKLERLNLFCNKVSDIHVLNALPRLKEVNMAANAIDVEEVKKQLKSPAIATFLSLPYVPFFIWRNDFFDW